MYQKMSGYEANYDMLLKKFDGKILLNKKEVAVGLEINYRTVVARYPFDENNTISIATLAMCLSRSAEGSA